MDVQSAEHRLPVQIELPRQNRFFKSVFAFFFGEVKGPIFSYNLFLVFLELCDEGSLFLFVELFESVSSVCVLSGLFCYAFAETEDFAF